MSAIFGEILLIQQQHGTELELLVWGDEFYVRYETRDGFTVCYHQSAGIYCYAEIQQGQLVSTGTPATKRPPFGIRRHLQESAEVQQARFDARYIELRPAGQLISRDNNIMRTIGPNNGLLNGRRISTGDVIGLTILVEFSDITATVDADEVDALLNDENYTAHGNFCSVREYFSIISNKHLNYRNHVVGPVALSHTKKYYESTSFVPEAFALAMARLEADGVELNQFDSQGEGIIDAVNFMYAGATVYGVNGNNNNPSDLWPHNSVREMRHNNLQTHFYMLTSMGRRAVDLTIGTFCHESAHLLCRFPDLYDYGRRDGDTKRSRGIGRYCLMGGGNHLNRGRTPSPVCAFLRDLVGWTDNEILLDGPGQHTAIHAEYGTVMKYRTSSSNEYFIIENRSQLGLDEHLPSEGMAIYHCDINGSNEWQDGTASRHYQIALLQADGRFDLESNQPSDNADLFGAIGDIALAHDTLPNSRQWDGSDSGLMVSDISGPGHAITFRVGNAVEPRSVITGEVVAHQLIPDDDAEGIHSIITFAEHGELTGLSVHVDITHSYIGDLLVSLVSPSGKMVVLHNRTGGTSNDLMLTYTKANKTELSDMNDQQIFGNWGLHIRDLEGQDVGRLNRWALEIDYNPQDRVVELQSQPKLEIPDDDVVGVSSVMSIEESGTLNDINVYVDISHTYIGDLIVELVSPSGQGAILHNRTGRFTHNLKLSYDRSMATSLDVLVGEPIQGGWMLRVRDLEGADIGKLEMWKLTLRYSVGAQ